MKAFLGFIAIVGALFAIAANFSAANSKYSCNGTMTNVDGIAEVFIELDEYRPWVALWSDSKGSLKVEVPQQFMNYFGHMEKAGNVYQIYDRKGEAPAGVYSTLSKRLGLKISDRMLFEGTCRQI